MLNVCPKCQRLFPTEPASAFCPSDATHLVSVSTVPPVADASDPFVAYTIGGKYEIRRVIADGGMGRVYEARELGEERRVAVKILHADIADDAVNIERFKREAETSLALDHTHIVDVFDFAELKPAPGRKDGAWYLVMEYLDGEELRAVIDAKKTLPMARVIRIMSQAAIALDGAHAKGAVHRDLKPDNLFLVRTPDGDTVKLLDFGSVKFTRGQDRGQKLTVMGTTIGSPYYMSPEQAKGLPDLDHRADVWALGAIIYEAAVGKVPFNAPNGAQILFKIIGEEPMPPSFANDAAPPQLDDFMVKALSKKREQRYQSCGELADALGAAFGLQGNHLEWANTSENDLAAKIQSAPPPAAPVIAMPSAAQPAMSAMVMGGGGPAAQTYASADDVYPVKKSSAAIYVAIIVALIIVGGVVALIALRSS